MKRSLLAAAAVVFAASSFAAGQVTYNDMHTDQVGSTNKARDIWSVVVNNDASNLIVTINLDPAANFATAAFNYGIGITTGPGAGGDTSANNTTHGNAYNRLISIDSSKGGMTDWVGIFGAGGSGTAGSPYTSYGFNTYVFGTPASTSAPGVWTKTLTVASGQPIATQTGGNGPSTVTIVVPFSAFSANLNLSVGNTFLFDVYSTGTSAGQTAYDSLSDASPTNGLGTVAAANTVQYNGTDLSSYTVAPEPASMALVALCGAGLLRRRRRCTAWPP